MLRIFHRKLLVWLAVVVLLLTMMPGISLAQGNVGSGGGTAPNVVMEWNLVTLNLIKGKNIPAGQFGSRLMAMVHIAMFDAINGVQPEYSPFLVDGTRPKLISPEAAAATAAYTLLSTLYPAEKDSFEALYRGQLSWLSDNPGLRRLAVRYGEQIAQAVLEWRQDDGSVQAAAGSAVYPDGTELGEWRRTPPAYMNPRLPGWGDVAPFAMTSGDQFRLIGPPPLDSYEYARDYNEVKTMGAKDSAVRTDEQTTIALFWPAGIPRIWNLVARDLVEEHQYDLLESARLFALLNVTLVDANIAGWKMKYHYSYWRPITAIQYGDVDGNDNTAGEVGWESLLPAPAFPEYVSGHSTVCAAAATLLTKFTGSDSFAFTVMSEANPNLPPRDFNSFWQAAREAGISRIYGGIHFNFSNVEGLETGRSVGRYVFENFMTPLTNK